MEEYGSQFDATVLQSRKKLEACDVLCFVYDSGDANSFAYVANLRVIMHFLCLQWQNGRIDGATQSQDKFQQLSDLPCVFVATKSDLDLVPQRFEVQPDVYCRNLGLPVPVSLSLKQHVTADIYRLLVGVAMDP